MSTSLPRRALAEFLGTGLLVTVVVGSGIAAERLSSDNGQRLLENAAATAAALPVLILIFAPVSGGHFNPVVSLVDWVLGRRAGTGIRSGDLLLYLPAQVAGAIGGALLANVMFGQAAGFATHTRSGGRLWLGELVATAGLILVIVALARTGNRRQVPWAVGAYIGAGVLVHLLDRLRQSSGRRRPDVQRQLCRDRPLLGAGLRRRGADRRCGRPRRRRDALPARLRRGE